jgi:flagellar basal-body rod protein FlgB
MFENLFGIHERALLLRSDRVGVLAANLANIDTPNYKARDMDFGAVLSGVEQGGLALEATHAGHIALDTSSVADAQLKYRVPYQASLDGNTVEAPVEQAAFAENSIRYQASLMFINRQIQILGLAITGQ